MVIAVVILFYNAKLRYYLEMAETYRGKKFQNINPNW
jgi:hypothetical protein